MLSYQGRWSWSVVLITNYQTWSREKQGHWWNKSLGCTQMLRKSLVLAWGGTNYASASLVPTLAILTVFAILEEVTKEVESPVMALCRSTTWRRRCRATDDRVSQTTTAHACMSQVWKGNQEWFLPRAGGPPQRRLRDEFLEEENYMREILRL